MFTDVSEVLAASNALVVSEVFATSITLMMEAASTSKTLVNFYQTTLRNNPEDSHLERKLMLFECCLQSICAALTCAIRVVATI
jgi:hypothetical protein